MNIIENIQILHNEKKHDEIIRQIDTLANDEKTDEIYGLLARALINEDRHIEAITILEQINTHDAIWHVRYALALNILHREPEALEHMKIAKDMGVSCVQEITNLYVPTTIDKWIEILEKAAQRRLDKIAFETPLYKNRNMKYDESAIIAKEIQDRLWNITYIGYTAAPLPSDEEIEEVENVLGYRLPNAYKDLIKHHNGGPLYMDGFALQYQGNYYGYSICSIYGIGKQLQNALNGKDINDSYWKNEWGYPDIGVVLDDTLSAGHDMIFLDYRDCGPNGEPCVVQIDQENDYEITFLAPNFKTFMESLVPFEDLEEYI